MIWFLKFEKAIGYWLLAIGYKLLAIGYWLLAIGYWLLAIGYWLLDLINSPEDKNNLKIRQSGDL